MPDKPDSIENLMIQRMELIGKLSRANSDHLRLLQMSSGLDVLLMKQPQSSQCMQGKSDAQARIASSESYIDSLESSLVIIDKSIETTLNSEV